MTWLIGRSGANVLIFKRLEFERAVFQGGLIGSIFRAFFYSIWGALLGFNPPIDTTDMGLIEAQANVFNWILLIVLAILELIFLAYFVTAKYYEKKKQQKKNLNKTINKKQRPYSYRYEET